MKVLQLVKTSIGAKWALLQMRELVKLGVEVHVAMPIDGMLVPKYKEFGVQIHPMTFSLKNIFKSCNDLKKIVKEVNPDLIHSHFVLTTLIMRIALRKDNRPRIFQVPGPLHLENFIFRHLDIMSAQKNDCWVGSCNWTNNCYESHGISKDRIFLSYYGSDMMHQKGPGNRKLHKELNIKEDSIIIGMVAYMYAPKFYLGQTRGLKGHEDFIDAISIVTKKYPNVYGVCVGGAWNNAFKYETKVRQYAKEKTDHIFFLGTRKDVANLYSDMYCVVHPSHSENLGGAAESLAVGVPTIATNIGGFPDIVKNNQTGLLIPAKSPSDLADAIIWYIQNKNKMLDFARNGEEFVKELLDVKNTSHTIWDIYNKVLALNKIKA